MVVVKGTQSISSSVEHNFCRADAKSVREISSMVQHLPGCLVHDNLRRIAVDIFHPLIGACSCMIRCVI